MKTFVTTIRVAFTCVDAEIARDRVMSIPFGDYDCGFEIVSVVEDIIDPKKDETLLKEYREQHGCWPIDLGT